jgi:hypothetical protein
MNGQSSSGGGGVMDTTSTIPLPLHTPQGTSTTTGLPSLVETTFWRPEPLHCGQATITLLELPIPFDIRASFNQISWKCKAEALRTPEQAFRLKFVMTKR